MPNTPTGLRNRTMLLSEFAEAIRRSELVSLNVEGISFTCKGAILSCRGSKTNQYGLTEQKAQFYSPDADTCPVRTLQAYITLIGHQDGPLFVRIRKGEQITLERLSDKKVD